MTGDLWVFGYGSLMWNPGFRFADATPARLIGFHRTFCIYSMHYRGTSRRPGLILGLDRGGACDGIAFRVAAADAADTRRYLRTRELVTGVYREAMVPLHLCEHGGQGPAAGHERPPEAAVTAMTYIAERAHPAYAGDLPLVVQARLVRKAKGLSGYNLDYVLNTADHLRELGIRERKIERLAGMLGRHLSRETGKVAARRSLAEHASGRPLRVPAGRLSMVSRRRFLFRRMLAMSRDGGAPRM